MSTHDPRVTLLQIADYARYAQSLCTDKTQEQLKSDWRDAFAFERVMEVLGEAVKRLPNELRARYPAVDWRGIAGMRDRVSHGYDTVDYEVLWHAVRTRVPALLTTVEQMLRDLDSDRTL